MIYLELNVEKSRWNVVWRRKMLGENDSYSRSSEISSHSAPPETEKINVSLELRLNSIFF